MRVIDQFLIIRIAIIMMILIMILIINIFVFTRQKSTKTRVLFFASSFLLELYFFVIFLKESSIHLEIEGKIGYFQEVILYAIYLYIGIGFLYYGFIKVKSKQSILLGEIKQVDIRKILDSIEDIIFIFDKEGKRVYGNSEQLNENKYNEKSRRLKSYLEYIFENTEKLESMEGEANWKIGEKLEKIIQFEIVRRDPERCYVLNIGPIIKREQNYGTIVVLHDITEEKGLQKKITENNKSLVEGNRILEEKIILSDKLKIEAEKLKVVEEIQNSLEFSIKKVVFDIEELLKNQEASKVSYNYIPDSLRKIYSLLRESIYNLSKKEEDI